MNGHFDGWKQYLDKEPGERQEEIEILRVIEDLPRDMSKPSLEGNVNKMKLATSKGEIVQEVTDEWREAILSGKTKKIVIIIKEQITNVLYDYEEGLDYLNK
ncbi:MAG: hypothetical protein PHF44_04250 [Candidatus Pacebacteria bacterium]|nr:hypothetical protein [Candidatus Paceibacterota bacterium]